MKTGACVLLRGCALCLSLLSIAGTGSANQAVDWPDRPARTFVYQISAKEAEKLLRSTPSDSLALRMLHTPAGSFEKEWDAQPEKGHFIFAQIERNRIHYNYVPVMPFQVFLYKEYGTLALQVVDGAGEVRDNARVRILKGGLFPVRVSFDPDSKTYRTEEYSEQTLRILTVEVDDFRAVFDLHKHLVNPSWYGRGEGRTPDFYSYMVTDKNRYKPRETVRFKSYALGGNRRPIKKPLEVWMRDGEGKYRKISELPPYNPGGFAGELYLHDSLRLKLDRTYPVQLRDSHGRTVASAMFRYEDYELFDNALKVELKEKVHYAPDTNRLEIRATDANGLPLPDVKADVSVLRRSVSRSHTDVLVLPDTLMHRRLELLNDGPTTVEIPSSVFGKADGRYEVVAELVSYDNQRLKASAQASFFYSRQRVEAATSNDTITFTYHDGGNTLPAGATLSYNDEKTGKQVTLPYRERFDQHLRSYNFVMETPSLTQRIATADIDTNLDAQGEIDRDSLRIRLINPLGLDLSWYIYKGNVLIDKGSGDSLDLRMGNIDPDMVHYLEVFYNIGGQDRTFRRTFSVEKERLQVDLEIPQRVYPGQTIDAEVRVKDSFGLPVRGVDLTAFAYNSLLNYLVPDLPYYGQQPQGREQRSSYSIKDKYYDLSAPLDYGYWRTRAGLDTMMYYRFAYPREGMFRHTVAAPDSLTQFAPYVFQKGASVGIYAIEDNGRPIWFSWTGNPRAYSFPAADTIKHRLMLRLHDRALLLDSISLERGMKAILSLDLDHLPKNVRTVPLDTRDMYKAYHLTTEEQRNYSRLICRLPTDGNEAWLRRGDTGWLIYHPLLSKAGSDVLAGPIPEGRGFNYTGWVLYRHEGGFSYKFEDNVVYKYPLNVCSDKLVYSFDEKVTTLNDFFLSRPVLDRKVAEITRTRHYWQPSAIRIVQKGMDLNFRIKPDLDSTGVTNLLFIDTLSGRVFFPDKHANWRREYTLIPAGTYHIVLLYNSGRYLRLPGVALRDNAYTEIDMAPLAVYPADSISRTWLSLSPVPYPIGSRTFSTQPQSTTLYTKARSASTNRVSGYVRDSSGEPVVGATVIRKFTTYGAITDLDGYFEMEVDGGNVTLTVSYIGYETAEVNVRSGSSVNITMEQSVMMLDEVVVVAYGTQRRSDMVASLSGRVAGISANGYNGPAPQAPPETAEEDGRSVTDEATEARIYRELMALGGLRSNFSDVAFWQPALVTGRDGKASFTATLPDNITKWNAVVLAMNARLKTGTARKPLFSYKPLMAELRTPQFLVEGDRSYFAGNIRNYTADKSIDGRIELVAGTDTLLNRAIGFAASHQDKVEVVAPASDSLPASYLFTRDDGYSDGERRTIPILPRGTEIAQGTLSFLRNGQTAGMKAGPDENLHVTLTDRQADVYLDAARYLRGYRYACNEQLASKLIGLLNLRLYSTYEGEKFEHDRNVNRIIRQLLDNVNDDCLWSWWGRSNTSEFWMSAHILRALAMARQAGYTVSLDMSRLASDYIDLSPFRQRSLRDIEILNALSQWGAKQNYAPAVDYFEREIRLAERRDDSIARRHRQKRTTSYMKEKLLLWEIRQQQGLDYTPDSVARYLHKDALGAVYCDDKIRRNWYDDEMSTTLIAYRIARRDSTLVKNLDAMQFYILGTKQYGWNTYRAASAVGTVFPDLLLSGSTRAATATVALSGAQQGEVSEFPYEAKLSPGEELRIAKRDGMPLILSSYSLRHVTEERDGEAFEVRSSLDCGEGMTAGKKATLTVTVKVKQKNAEYVLIEIPIPAGCSYAAKPAWFPRPETHREYFKEKTVIFCQALPEGEHTFRIDLLPRYTGSYTLNPAKAEMMYFPVVNANNAMRRTDIMDETAP